MASPQDFINQGANYPNPLDNFRTYSYHFVMTLASTTQAFIDQIGGGLNSISQSNSNQPSPLLNAVLAANAPGQKFHIGNSDVYLILDTRRFSQYSIVDWQMNHTYGTGDSVNPTTPGATHTMQLIDTTGISFFNLMMDLFRNKIKSTRFSAFFLLAIIFVGHKDDGTTETVAVTYIPMTILTMGLSFSASGSTFDMTFWEAEGGQERGGAGTDQLNYVGDAKSFTTQNFSNTVGGMLDAFEKELNVRSLDFFQKYTNALNIAGKAVPGQQLGKLVQYMITYPTTEPNNWGAFPLDIAPQSTNVEKMYIAATQDNVTDKSAAAEIALATITPGPSFSTMKLSDSTTIPDAIKRILESSSKILALASSDKRQNGQAIAFKILTVVTSDDTSYLVHYDIYPFYLPIINVDKQKSQNSQPNSNSVTVTSGSTNQTDVNQYENVITYNYLFSGQNNAIIHLDVKFDPETAVQALDTNLNIGTSRFNQLAAQGQKKSAVAQGSVGAKDALNVYAPDLRANDPIFFPIKSLAQKDNNQDQRNAEAISDAIAQSQLNIKQQYTQTFASVHFLSNMQLDMTVRGNPNIIKKFADRNTRGGYPQHGQIIKSPQTITTFTQSGQNTAEANFNTFLATAVSSAKAAYYANYYYPRIADVLSPPKSMTGSTNDPLLHGPDVAVHPIYVVIKIFAPNVDSTGNFIAGGPMFTDEFFYNGVYRLLLVETKFSGGEFTHNMTLITDIGNTTQNDNPSGT